MLNFKIPVTPKNTNTMSFILIRSWKGLIIKSQRFDNINVCYFTWRYTKMNLRGRLLFVRKEWFATRSIMWIQNLKEIQRKENVTKYVIKNSTGQQRLYPRELFPSLHKIYRKYNIPFFVNEKNTIFSFTVCNCLQRKRRVLRDILTLKGQNGGGSTMWVYSWEMTDGKFQLESKTSPLFKVHTTLLPFNTYTYITGMFLHLNTSL